MIVDADSWFDEIVTVRQQSLEPWWRVAADFWLGEFWVFVAAWALLLHRCWIFVKRLVRAQSEFLLLVHVCAPC